IGLGIETGYQSPSTIERVYPNPSTDEFHIEFFLARKSNVELRVIDSKGVVAKVLHSQILPEGNHTMKWDTSDRSAKKAGRGIYFIELITDDSRNIHKISLL
ncbi:MAG: T9SS type A sorting domain-containing protein, partial [Bacteroidales bacterium]